MLSIRIQALIISDDGVAASSGPTHPSFAGLTWEQHIDNLIQRANDFYEDQGIGFRLKFNPATDLEYKQSTLMNRNQPAPALVPDPNGNDVNQNAHARQLECWKYPGRAVLMWRDYDPSLGDEDAHSTGSYGDYVYFNKAADDSGITVAHELGHYLHLSHTHDRDNGVKTKADAAAAIKDFVEKQGNPVAAGAQVFDFDAPAILDTPPDPGPGLYITLNGGDRCAGPGTVKIDVTFSSGTTKTYPLQPDRTNFMSYFTRCTTQPTASPQQRKVMEDAVRTGNRNPLLHTAAMIGDGKAHFFQPGRYLRYDVSRDKADAGYPKPIEADWPGLPWSHIDAAAIWPDGRTYFFHGDEYVKYDRQNHRVFESYPRQIGKEWKGVWDKDIDAVLVLNDDTAWFFKGRKCIKFDIPGDQGEGVDKAVDISDRFPGVWGAGIDAALRWPNGKVYFLKGDRYARYEPSLHRTDQDIHQIRGNWPGLWSSIDAAVVWNDGSVRFLDGNQFKSYNLLGDETQENYPKSLTFSDWSTWGGDFPWTSGFDAGAVWDHDKAFLFKGGECVRFDLAAKKMDKGPRPIGEVFEGVGNGELDAVVRWDNGKAYFFRGQEYIQVDVASKKAISGPLDIGTFWKGIPSQRFDAVIALWNFGKAYFFKGERYWRYDIKADRADEGYPTGITQGGWPGLAWS